jgi:hypothetical protein
MMIWSPVVVVLIVLHAPGGVEVSVVPGQITFTRNPPAVRSHDALHFPKEANCLVGLADGKAIPVTETCDYVKLLIEQAENPKR